jgi:hypothetical protein
VKIARYADIRVQETEEKKIYTWEGSKVDPVFITNKFLDEIPKLPWRLIEILPGMFNFEDRRLYIRSDSGFLNRIKWWWANVRSYL